VTASLADSVAVVTGASGGLGRATALALAAVGAEVVLIARRADPLHALAAEIAGGGGMARAVPCDVTDRAALEAALAPGPAPRILVTCAGGNRPEPFTEITEEALAWSWQLNVRAAFVAGQLCARRMISAGEGGAIVHVTSQMGHVGAPLRTVYCMAKHALEGLAKAMAVELAPHGIRVNTVAPTFVETPMTRPFLADPDTRRDIVRRIPLGRLGEPDDVAQAVLFAATSPLMTGAVSSATRSEAATMASWLAVRTWTRSNTSSCPSRLPAVRSAWPGARAGFTCACVRRAAISAAATTLLAVTRLRITRRAGIRSSARPSRARIGAGATWTS
jgi:NAD(P)-dependent dehydrogenase (short-subunit alcohol dehydrogenase family)